MPKLEGSLYTNTFRPLADAYQSLLESERKAGKPDPCPPNNNRTWDPIRLHFDDSTSQKEEEKNVGSSSSPCLWHGQGTVGTYDTVRLTSTAVRMSDIRNPLGWNIGRNTPFGRIEDGGIPSLSKRIPLDSNGKEVLFGMHVAVVGLDFFPSSGSYKGQMEDDRLVVTVPSMPAMMYADPLRPLAPDDVGAWLERLQTVVANHVHCDVGTFSVSRLDASTVYRMTEPASAFIGYLNEITGAKQYRTNKKYYEDQTVQFFNKQQAVGFYDKGAKEEHRFWETLQANDKAVALAMAGQEGTLNNALRYEVQKKNTKAVEAAYKRTLTAYDLSKEEVWRQALQIRADAFDKYFPHNQNIIQMSNERYAVWKWAQGEKPEEAKEGETKKRRKRNVLADYFTARGILNGTETVEGIHHLMRLDGYSRAYIGRYIKKIRSMQTAMEGASDLYQEVREKVHADLKVA